LILVTLLRYGRARYRTHLRKPTCGFAAIPHSYVVPLARGLLLSVWLLLEWSLVSVKLSRQPKPGSTVSVSARLVFG
jgi:hypothetical protein